MNKYFVAVVFAAGIGVCVLTSAAVLAESPAASSSAVAPHPWEKAQAVLKATRADIQRGGILAVQGHVPDLEQALADANQSFGSAASEDGTVYVLADGLTETLLAMSAVAAGQYPGGRKGVAVENPFPTLSLYLASYYNEIGRPAEALRVLDASLALPTVMGQHLDQTRSFLISERGAALSALKRWPDMLADCDEGLQLPGLKDPDRARLLRARGFALIELGRLEDAEAAYNDSLKLVPDNAIALRELQYITRLKVGGAPTATLLTMPNAVKPK